MLQRASLSTHASIRLSQLLHVDLHWLDVSDRVKLKLGLTVHRCLSNKAPYYLADSCTLVDLQHRQSAAATLSSTSPPGCTTTQPQHTWPSVIFCRRSYRLEFASRRAPSSRLYRRHIQTVARKPIYDFLLVINTNLPPILHRFGVIAFQMSTRTHQEMR